MERVQKLLHKVTAFLSKIKEKHSRRTAVIVGAVVTVAVVSFTSGAVADGNVEQVQEAQGGMVQEDLPDPDEDPDPDGTAQAEGSRNAASGSESSGRQKVPQGFLGVIEGVRATKASNDAYHPIGTNVEEVLVGQRIARREEVSRFDVSSHVQESVNSIDDHSWELVEQTKISDNDYGTLLAIVEAEAGGEDMKGRILVANVIFNRVNSDQFPDTVTEVVWDQSGGSAQFSPTSDGRIHTVTVSDTTREAVNRAIDGEDYSQGALFFLERRYAEPKNVKWFDSNLKFLFQHGVHSFYTY